MKKSPGGGFKGWEIKRGNVWERPEIIDIFADLYLYSTH